MLPKIVKQFCFVQYRLRLQTMIRRNMDRNKKEELDNLTNSRLQTMIRRNMDRNSATVALFRGQIEAITCMGDE